MFSGQTSAQEAGKDEGGLSAEDEGGVLVLAWRDWALWRQGWLVLPVFSVIGSLIRGANEPGWRSGTPWWLPLPGACSPPKISWPSPSL